MKKKYTLILLFMLAFAGVTLLVCTSALADWDRFCDGGAPPNTCIEINELGAPPVYILKIFYRFEGGGPDPEIGDPATDEILALPGVNWPIHDTANKRTIFRYITGVSQAYKEGNVGKPSAQSYAVFSLYDFPALGTAPSGAIMDIKNLHYSCEPKDIGARKAVKVNKPASFTKDGIIEFYEPLHTGVDKLCGYAWVNWSNKCDAGSIVVPAGRGLPPQRETKWECEDSGVTVTVYVDPCTRRIYQVDCVRNGENLGSVRTDNPWAYLIAPELDNPGSTISKSLPFGQAGPGTPGCIVCLDPLPAVLWGNEIHWCGGPPPEAP